MIHQLSQLLVSSLLVLSQPVPDPQTDSKTDADADQSTEQTQQEPMSSEIARARLAEAMSPDQPIADRIELLSEIYARCEDPSLRSASAFGLGSIMILSDEQTQGVIEDGIGWLRLADTDAADAHMRARARYNIGHARYLLAQQQQGSGQMPNPGDMGNVLEALNDRLAMLVESAGAFRSVYEIDRTQSDAIENLERVRREIKRLREQIQALEDMIEQQKEQQRQQQQEQSDAAEELRELAEQQRQESEQNSSQDEQQDSDQQQQDQSQISEQTNEQQDKAEQITPGDSQEGEQIRESLKEAQQAQQRAQQALEEGDMERAAQEQEQAAEALEQAAEQMQQLSESQSQQEGEQGQDGEAQQPSEGQGEREGEGEDQDGDEISEIAEFLLEKERREREARKAYRATGKPVRVEKDW